MCDLIVNMLRFIVLWMEWNFIVLWMEWDLYVGHQFFMLTLYCGGRGGPMSGSSPCPSPSAAVASPPAASCSIICLAERMGHTALVGGQPTYTNPPLTCWE